MKKIYLLLITLILTGCASSGYKPHPNDSNKVIVWQHFSVASPAWADQTAANYCAQRNGKPKLLDTSIGCLLCKNENSGWMYECTSNAEIQQAKSNTDSQACSSWGFTYGTDGFSQCMLRLYEVRMAVDIAAQKNQEIRNLNEMQRRAAEQQQTFNLLNLSNQMMQSQQPTQPVVRSPFICNKFGNTVTCN
jgi:hypothetical protein